MARSPVRQDNRKVSFSRRHMPGAPSKPSVHRASASPSRSCLRTVSTPAQEESSIASGSRHASGKSHQGRRRANVKRLQIKAYRGRSKLFCGKLNADNAIPWPLTKPLEWKDPAEVDSLVCQKLHGLVGKVLHFASHFQPVYESHRGEASWWALVSSLEHAKTVRYIGYLALADKDGVNGWNQMLTQPQSLQALVLAIVGQVLKHYVFGASWFGKKETDEVFFGKTAATLQEEDGFYRSTSRALRCQQHNELAGKHAGEALEQLEMAQERLASQLLHLMLPLYQLGRRGGQQNTATAILYHKVLDIVVQASTLSRQMRLERDVVFEWSDVWKGAKFDTQHMEAVNLGQMLQTSPYVKDAANAHAVLRDGAPVEQSEPIVQVVAFPGLVVYRRAVSSFKLHTGSDAEDSEWVARSSLGNNMTVRTITKSVVLLKWGQQTIAPRLAGSSAWNDAVKSGDMSRFAEDHNGIVELADLFVHFHGPKAFEEA